MNRHGDKFYYFLRENPKEANGKYIPKEKEPWVQQMLQQEYNEAIVKMIREEIQLIDRYLLKANPTRINELYYQMSKGRQRLIHPVALSDEEYVSQWESKEYQGKAFAEDAPEFYTNKGERVRSKSEVIIANLLEKYQIPYRYEYPIKLEGIGTVYPDFTTLCIKKRTEIYIEHLGLIDDEEYREKNIRKLTCYEMNGIRAGYNLIITYESARTPLNTRLVEKKIKDIYDIL